LIWVHALQSLNHAVCLDRSEALNEHYLEILKVCCTVLMDLNLLSLHRQMINTFTHF
jgi:hypothetical protein